MYFLKEVTDWGDTTPNHIYILSDKKSTKILGYIPDRGSIIMFDKPMTFDKRGRKFVEWYPDKIASWE